jgi:hypothetical protein
VAAFKHGVTETGIRAAFSFPLFNGLIEGFGNKYLLTGFDHRGTVLEVMYNLVDEQTVYIFHAMRCRKAFRMLRNQHYEEGSMAVMTEEEAYALDDLLTRTTPRINPAVRGVGAGFRMVAVDDFSADYLTARALATRRSPEEIIAALIRKELACDTDEA